MTTHAYGRGAFARSIAAQDVLLLLALVVLAFLPPPEPLATALRVAIPAALVWGFVTLHLPSRIDVDAESIAFHRYGRVHRFVWRDVTRLRVRRFLVRDRVLVRLDPSSAWRGRYWIFESIDGFDALVAELERRERELRPRA